MRATEERSSIKMMPSLLTLNSARYACHQAWCLLGDASKVRADK